MDRFPASHATATFDSLMLRTSSHLHRCSSYKICKHQLYIAPRTAHRNKLIFITTVPRKKKQPTSGSETPAIVYPISKRGAPHIRAAWNLGGRVKAIPSFLQELIDPTCQLQQGPHPLCLPCVCWAPASG